MQSINVTTARKDFYSLVNNRAEPILITSKENDAVLISKDDWEALEETLYLTNIKGMKESLIQGMNTPLEKCLTEEDLGLNV